MKNSIPVIIFTYNRLDVFKKTFKLLSENIDFYSHDIVIVNDGPKTLEDVKKVEKLREYISTLKSQYENISRVIFRNENYGLSKNIISGITDILTHSESVIVLEDDIAVTKDFLVFMKKSLEFYKDCDRVFSISGFSFELVKFPANYKYLNYVTRRPFPWGWGIWKDRWEKCIWDKSILKGKWRQEMKEDFNLGGSDLSPMLLAEFDDKLSSWDVRLVFNQYLLNMYSIFPRESRTYNIGWGEDSTHNKGLNIYRPVMSERTNVTTENFVKDMVLVDTIDEAFRYQFSIKNRIIFRLKSLFLKGELYSVVSDFVLIIKRRL